GLEMARFYTSLLPDSRIEGAWSEDENPIIVTFTLGGAPYQIMSVPGGEALSNATSLSVTTEDQTETDRLWAALLADGGKEMACGWLTDKYGLCWQIVPRRLTELLSSADKDAAGRAMDAMNTMIKIDIAALEAAATNTSKETA
ncbi:MAG: VOC family protein, partial [Pseudomonadota bacterium]